MRDMFSGIVERRARVIKARPGADGQRLELEAEEAEHLDTWEEARVGESISVSGVCLTVVAADSRRLCFDVVPETLSLTTLGHLESGDWVNLEKALAVGDRFGGHFVTGHIDGTGEIVARRTEGDQVLFEIRPEKKLLEQMIHKGSITVEGVSLTLVEVAREKGWFSFAAIPHTLEVTTLGTKQVGDPVNLETDAFGKWVLHGLKTLRE